MSKFDPDAYLGGTTVQTEDKKKREAFNPDAYLAAPRPAQPQETAAQTLGRSTISMADSALNALTGTVDVGARALARAYYGGVKGMTGPALEQRIAQETTSPKDVVGRAFGVTGTPGYEQAPLRQLGTAVSNVVGENVIQPVAQATGLSPEYVGDVVTIGSVPLAGPAGRAAAATGRAAKATAQVPVDVARGALGRATGYIAKPGEAPTGYQVPSSRIPLGETFIPAEQMAQLRQGMPISEASVRPISELAPGPVMALSGGEIPIAGQAARAFGERLGETYRNPLTAAADIGSVFLTGGIPVLTAGRGALGLAQAGADAYLARKGFTSLTQAEREALNRGVNPFYTAPAAPSAVNMQPGTAGFDFRTASQAANAGVAGPVAPVVAAEPVIAQPVPRLTYNPTPPTIFVAPEGVAGTDIRAVNQAGIQQKYPPVTVGPVAADQTAAAAAQAAKDSATRQKLLDMINQSREKGLAEPIVKPVAPGEPPAIGPAPVTAAPSAEVLSSISELGKKSLAEIRFDIKNTGKGAITTKNNQVVLDKAAYDDLAAQYGVKLNWDELGEVKKGMADAREQVNKFVLNKIKEQRGPEKRGPQMRTLQKQAEQELGIGQTFTPEQEAIVNARLAAGQGLIKGMPSARTGELPVTPVAPPGAAAPAQGAGMSEALRQRLEALKTQGKYKEPTVDTSKMMSESNLKKGDTFTVNDDNFAGPSYQGFDKEFANEIPKNTEWVKEINYENANGDIVVTEYISKATKKQPEYKLVDKFMNDESSQLYVKKGNDWELVADEKTIIDTKEAAVKANYEQRMKAYYEPIRQEINMTFDEFMALPEDKLIELGKQVRKSKKTPPPGVSQMMTGDMPTPYAQDYFAAKLAGIDPPPGSFVKDGILYQVLENSVVKNMPEELRKSLNASPIVERQIDINTGKVIKGPIPLAQELEQILKKTREQNKKGK